jgi:predicted CXXCH cytochrome family protein
LRAKRARFVLSCALVAIAGVLIGLSWNRWRDVVSPGALSRSHHTLEQDCTRCHGANGADLESWLRLAPLDTGRAAGQCVACHKTQASHPLKPHGVPGDAPEIACAACHHEHRGPTHNLAAFDQNQCHHCHAKPFRSFELDHPEFEDYPRADRERIKFDHVTHQKHFAEEGVKAAWACSTCHRPDPAGRMMPIEGFAPTCTSCHHHAQQIRTAAGEGVPFFRWPGLDVGSLESAGLSVGSWPRDAEGPAWNGELTPFMRAILSQQGETARALELLDRAAAKKVWLFDLYDADREQLRAAQQIGRAVKQLLDDLTTRKADGLTARLGIAAPDRELAMALSGELPLDQPRGPLQELYAGLEELRALLPIESSKAPTVTTPTPVAATPPSAPVGSLDDLLGGPPPPPPPAVDPKKEQELADAKRKAAEAEARLARAGVTLEQSPRWSVRPLDFSVRYRPVGHADPFLISWLEQTGRSHDASQSQLFAWLADPKSGPGSCTKCHAVTSLQGQNLIEWIGRRAENRGFSPARFDHQPHLRELAGDCSRCHRAAVTPVPGRQHAPIERALCIECHQAGKSPSDCMTCHRYHFGGAPQAALR